MKTWIQRLTDHYQRAGEDYPDDKLLVVFDIDGTILDARYVICHALKAFDTNHDTGYFQEIGVDDIDFHEGDHHCITERYKLSAHDSGMLASRFIDLLTESAVAPEACEPFPGVYELIKSLQMLPNTYVGLNTGRPEFLRFNTLRSLNRLGRQYGVRFADELLFMQPDAWQDGIEASKIKGIEYFRRKGYRVIAFLDNEPENLHAVSKIDEEELILLLHARTIFRSSPAILPARAVGGSSYDASIIEGSFAGPSIRRIA